VCVGGRGRVGFVLVDISIIFVPSWDTSLHAGRSSRDYHLFRPALKNTTIHILIQKVSTIPARASPKPLSKSYQKCHQIEERCNQRSKEAIISNSTPGDAFS